jgi:hypothetical protein
MTSASTGSLEQIWFARWLAARSALAKKLGGMNPAHLTIPFRSAIIAKGGRVTAALSG